VCPEDVQLVHQTGIENYRAKDVPVRIISQDGDSVKVLVRQVFSESGIDHMFLQYKTSTFSQTCEETTNVEPDTCLTDGIEITLRCNSRGFALLDFMLVDEHEDSPLNKEGNDATIPKCCHPDIEERAPAVIFNLVIACEPQCADAIE